MRKEVRSGLQVLRGARSFLATIEVKPEFAVVAKLLHDLDGTIAEVLTLAAEQDASGRNARSATVVLHRLVRRTRREYLVPMSRIARNAFPDDTVLRQALRLPPSGASVEVLVAAIRGITSRTSQEKDAFIAAGLADDFLEQLTALGDTLLETVDERRALVARRVGATQAIERAFSRGRTSVAVLNSVVRPWLELHMPDRVGDWDSLSRFVRESPESAAPSTPLTPLPTTLSPEAHAA
jgi:ribosomal protein L18E